MAQKIGRFDWRGEWADRDAINRNAETLETVEADVGKLEQRIAKQARDILQLRAIVEGLVDMLQATIGLDEHALDDAVAAALERLAPRPPQPKPPPQPPQPPTDPYRNLPPELAGADEDSTAAKELLGVAQEHYFSKRFSKAREIYQDIVRRYGATKQAAIAREQLENLRGV